MAGRIRAFDWSTTPLGPIAGWSERLKLIVEHTLDSPLVASLVCGPERILVYNDAAAALYGDRHPAALGRPLPEAFPEGWATVAPFYERAFAGEAVQVAGQPLDTRGEGAAADLFDALLTPVREGDGRIAYVHMTGVEVGDRVRAEAARRESETRNRLLIESWVQAVWETDASGVVTADSPSWRAYTGQTMEEWLGYGWLDAIHPDDRAYAERQWREAIAAHGLVDAEFRLRAPDGGWRWTNVRAAPLLDANGRIEKWLGLNIDVDERTRAEAALRESEARQRALIEGIPQLVWRAFDGGHWTWASPQWTAYTGQAEADSHGFGWLDTVHPDDRDSVMAIWTGAVERGEYHADYRVRHAASGAYHWYQTRATPVRDGSGAIVEWLGTSTDVDDLRILQDRQDVMVAELQHRTRNLIAVVRGIADDTMDETGPTEAFRDAFFDRLTALSRVQGLLSRSEAEPITIGALVRMELDALGAGSLGDRIAVVGPDVFLRPSTVQTLALALHELATNARKYGALSHEGGRLAVSWRERDEGDERRLDLDWVETGLEQAPDRSASPKVGGGYGRELIEHALPHVTGARASYALTASGVRCSIDIAVRPGTRSEP